MISNSLPTVQPPDPGIFHTKRKSRQFCRLHRLDQEPSDPFHARKQGILDRGCSAVCCARCKHGRHDLHCPIRYPLDPILQYSHVLSTHVDQHWSWFQLRCLNHISHWHSKRKYQTVYRPAWLYFCCVRPGLLPQSGRSIEAYQGVLLQAQCRGVMLWDATYADSNTIAGFPCYLLLKDYLLLSQKQNSMLGCVSRASTISPSILDEETEHVG